MGRSLRVSSSPSLRTPFRSHLNGMDSKLSVRSRQPQNIVLCVFKSRETLRRGVQGSLASRIDNGPSSLNITVRCMGELLALSTGYLESVATSGVGWSGLY